MADQTTQGLLIKVNATTELLRQQMRLAEQSMEQFQRGADGNLKQVDRAFARTEGNSNRFARQIAGLKTGFAGVTDNLTGGLQSAASQVPILGSTLSGLSGVALGTAAGFGLLATALVQGVRDTDAYEESIRSLGAVLDATGNKTGYTKAQLADFAEEMETAFAIDAGAILKAEQSLSSFDGVAGTTFKRAIKDAADMSAVFGGDLTDNTQKVGGALQNLAEGNVEGLSRGFKFLGTATLEAIGHLAKVGDTAGAQELLLKSLEARLGGAAAAKAAGLSGAFFRFTDSIADATRGMIQQIGIIPILIQGLNNLTNVMGGGAANGLLNMRKGAPATPSGSASDAGLAAARARASVNQIKAEPKAGNAQYRADTNYDARLASAQRLLAVREKATGLAIDGARAEVSTFQAEAKASADAVKAAGALAKSLGTGAGGKGAKSGRAGAVRDVTAAVDELAGVLPATMKMLDELTKTTTANLTSGAIGDQKQDTDNSDNVHQQRLYEIEQEKQKTLDAIAEQKRRSDNAVRETADLYQTLFRDGTKGLWDSFEQIGLNAVTKVLGKLTVGLLSGKSLGSLGSIGSLFSDALGGAFAGGGSPPVGKISMVGERGPELFIPKVSGTIIPNNMLGGGGGGPVTYVTNSFNLTGAVLTQDIMNQINAVGQGAALAGHQMTMTALSKSASRRLA